MIADRIKELRERVNLTQSELAKRLNITRSSVNAWEMGISAPSTQYLVELSEIFKVPTDYILGVGAQNYVNIDSLTDEQVKILYSLLQYFNRDNEKL